MYIRGEKAGSWAIDDVVSLGMPRTFKARHAEVGTDALLKVVPHSVATAEGQAREVEALKRLSHPNLPEVLDFGVDHDKGLLWTAFRWIDAESLLDRLRAGGLDWRDACHVLRDVAAALAHAHGDGIVHRDLRPSAVLVGPDWGAWVGGFDYAMTQEQLERLSEAPFGDLAYLAPEVLRDPTHHGAKADVYAFGCLMYETLTGRSAFPAAVWGERADQATRMLEWKARSQALDPGAAFPEWFRSMVVKCTDPDADRRLPDIEAIVGWLDAARPSWQHQKAKVSSGRTEEGAPPAIVMSVAPSLRPVVRPPPVRLPVAVEPAPPVAGVPVFAMYFGAALAGCLSALGFSAVVILFMELRDGVL